MAEEGWLRSSGAVRGMGHKIGDRCTHECYSILSYLIHLDAHYRDHQECTNKRNCAQIVDQDLADWAIMWQGEHEHRFQSVIKR